MMASWQVPLMQPLNPWVQGTPTHQPTLHVIDFSKLTKHRCRLMLPQHFFKSSPPSSLPAFNSTKKRKRKKAVAGLPVVEVALLHISPLLSCLSFFYI